MPLPVAITHFRRRPVSTIMLSCFISIEWVSLCSTQLSELSPFFLISIRHPGYTIRELEDLDKLSLGEIKCHTPPECLFSWILLFLVNMPGPAQGGASWRMITLTTGC